MDHQFTRKLLVKLPLRWVVRLLPTGTWFGLFMVRDANFATAFIAVIAATFAMWDWEQTLRMDLSLSMTVKALDKLVDAVGNGGARLDGPHDGRHRHR